LPCKQVSKSKSKLTWVLPDLFPFTSFCQKTIVHFAAGMA